MSYPYDGLSDKELTAIIIGHVPWPLYNLSHPPMVPNPKYIAKDDTSQAPVNTPYPKGHYGYDMAQATANAKRDAERMIFYGMEEGASHIEATHDEWTQYRHLTGFVGGMADYPYWSRDHVASLSRDAKLALIEKLNQLDKEGK